MRQAGTLNNERDALRFADYLLTLGIATRPDEDSGEWVVWILDEDHLSQAKEELTLFRQNPDADKYQSAEAKAHVIRVEQVERVQQVRENVVHPRFSETRPGLTRRSPLVMAIIVACSLVALATDFGSKPLNTDTVTQTLMFCNPMHYTVATPDPSPMLDIEQGQVWRLITPIFLHAGIPHILFNLFLFYSFGTQIENARGPWRLALLILVIAVLSNFAQAIMVSSQFVGISGVVYGLFGYIWMKAVYRPSEGMYVSPNTVLLLVLWFLFGAMGVLDFWFHMSIANWTHGIGLAVGIAMGYAPVFFASLKQRQRP